jgi:hypothetical protein
VSLTTRSPSKLAFFAALSWAGACSYPDYGFSNAASGGAGAGGEAGSGGFGGSAGAGGASGAAGSNADAGDASDSDAKDGGASCKPSDELVLGKTVAGTNDPLSASNVSNSIKDYSCATKACDGFEATWSFTPSSSATYRFTLMSLDADCDLYVVGPGVCNGTCASSSSSSTQKVGTSESVDVALAAAKTYFVSADAAPGALCHFQLAVIQL